MHCCQEAECQKLIQTVFRNSTIKRVSDKSNDLSSTFRKPNIRWTDGGQKAGYKAQKKAPTLSG
jgi:hypothetical protein